MVAHAGKNSGKGRHLCIVGAQTGMATVEIIMEGLSKAENQYTIAFISLSLSLSLYIYIYIYIYAQAREWHYWKAWHCWNMCGLVEVGVPLWVWALRPSS